MGQISSLFAWKVIRQVDAGADQRALLSIVGLDPDSEPDPSTMVSAEDYYTFLY